MWEDSPGESEDSADSKGDATVTISEDSLRGHQCDIGDTLTFKVVSKDNGQIGLQMEGYGGNKEAMASSDEMMG